jgi:PAS domain S-box-containing protein
MTTNKTKPADANACQDAVPSPVDAALLSPEEMERALHELREHQLELEMQNEELRRVQVALDAARARYFDLYDLAPVGYCTISEAGLIIEANLTAAGLLGVEWGALVKRPFTAFILKEDQDSYRLARNQLFATGEAQLCELRMAGNDGTVFWARLNGTLAREADGAPTCRIVLSDISEHKRADEELRESEERYHLLFESESDALFLIDTGTGLVIDTNRAALELYGYGRDELLTKKSWDLSAEPAETQRLTRETRICPGQVISIPERLHRKKDGTVFPVDITARNLTLKGKWCLLVAARDLTERKQAEEERALLEAQLRQFQKMESVGRLAGGVAHNFNNMLAVILGYTELAMGQVDPEQPLYADLGEVFKAATRSADLTRELLAFARKQTVTPKVLDLNETVAGQLKMLQPLIGENIRINWHPGADLWPVWVDPSQIDHIMVSLCVNAQDAIAHTGTLTIGTENRSVDYLHCAGHPHFAPGEYVMLSVSDDGCGINQDALEHIFEPFFTTKEVGKGTGMGLATVYGIAKQSGGFIDVHSEVGQGSTFSVYLPRNAGKAAKALIAGVPVPPTRRGEETILLAEDEPAVLKMTRKMLESMGYTVLAAGTPAEAIQMAREHAGEIALLLTDVVMPEMNGRDLARNILALHPRVKRLFMSGYTADVIAQHGVLDVGTHFIYKPFSREDLADKVRQVLDSQ